MNHDFDWLDYLSLLNPKCALQVGLSGMPQVTREDVLASLAGISTFTEWMVSARTGQLGVDVVAQRSHLQAFILALKLDPALMCGFAMTEFKLVWREACVDVFGVKPACPYCERGYSGVTLCKACGGTGMHVRSGKAAAKSACISRDKWDRISLMLPVCYSVIAQALEQVRQQLKFNLRRTLAA